MKFIVYTFFLGFACWIFVVAGVSNLILLPFMSTLFVAVGGHR